MNKRKIKVFWLQFNRWINPRQNVKRELKEEAINGINILQESYTKEQSVKIIKLMIKELDNRNKIDVNTLTSELEKEMELTELIKDI